MRLHSLTIAAFGPFAGEHTVDFDELNDAGVFLLTGPTGAGKTSVLDAICFALFGVVPGGRGVKCLKSDHASQHAKPEVTLDFTVGGRRLVVRRTPEWSRPKRRGQGRTPEKAAATLLERVGPTEHLLSSGAQEVGHSLTSLLGMTATQFQQVAMLPQGQFQTFLRASSQERQGVLQQLFRTERFTSIEQWVHDRSRELRAAAADGEALVRRVVDTMADRADVDCPEELRGDRLGLSAHLGEVLPWADTTLVAMRADLATLQRAHVATAEASRRATDDHGKATEEHRLAERRDAALAVLRDLGADAQVEHVRARLAADAHAQSCRPLLALHDSADAELVASLAVRDAALAELGLPAGLPIADLERALAETHAHLQAAENSRELHSRLRDLKTEQSAAARATRDLAPKLGAVEAELEQLPARRRKLAARLSAASELAGRVPALTAETASAQARAGAAAELEPAAAKLVRLQDSARGARDACADARERLLDLTARRLSGMAAELASGLADGEPCQVCGSTVHPGPASTEGDPVSSHEQSSAQRDAERMRLAADSAAGFVHTAELRVQALTQQCEGLRRASADTAVDEVVSELSRAHAAASQVQDLTGQLDLLDARSSECAALLRQLDAEAVRLEHQESLTEVALRALRLEIGDTPSLDPFDPEILTSTAGRAAALAEVAERSRALDRDAREVARLLAAVASAGAAERFADVPALRAALLADQERDRLRDLREAASTRQAEAEMVLADAALSSLPAPLPDLELLGIRHRDSLEAESAAARADHVQQEVVSAVEHLHAQLVHALEDWAPARERFATADSMSQLVRGMSADNQLQMRLSAYVLGARLDQVVAAANERLEAMREQRYLLERTPEAARRGSQAGLGLRVLDGWTGESRDPATLSGGETFVVSLALALGLADVVSQEAGGVTLETLFVDEGFGSLDSDTLDDVMDRLDELRVGGRTVGVVSHVSELRNRIPVQLHVHKGRQGSSLEVANLVA